VVAQGAHLAGEQLGFVAAAATGAGILAEEKDLVHADVKRVGLAGVGKLIDQVEHHIVYPGMQRAVTAAVNALVGGVQAGGLVEFGVRAEQAGGVFGPGLVAQQIDLGNQPHAGFAAGRRHLHQVFARERRLIRHFRMFGEAIVVVDLQHQQVDALPGQRAGDEANRQGDVFGARRRKVQAAHGQFAGSQRHGQEREHGEPHSVLL